MLSIIKKIVLRNIIKGRAIVRERELVPAEVNGQKDVSDRKRKRRETWEG